MEPSFTISPGSYIAPGIGWLNTNAHAVFSVITTVVEAMLSAVQGALTALPAGALIAVAVILATVFGKWRIGALTLGALGFCWAMGLWQKSMESLSLVIVSVLISVAIAFPLGVWAARNYTVRLTMRPILDIMQTVPPWVYLIPAVIFFSLGRTPALIATVIYGVPPMLRFTTLALTQVPIPFLELGKAVGATKTTVLLKIELPLAKPTLLVGLNQCILLSLSMVVLAGLVGAGGLGGEVTRGLTRMQLGIGLRSGLCIVAIALLLDRLSQAALNRSPRRAKLS
jgi:glycine betaine/proline transport system permease protein